MLATNSKLDFKIPSPSSSQILNFEKNELVEKVFPYYDLITNIKVNNSEISNQNVMIIPLKYINSFPFLNNNLIIKENLKNSSECLFIDYAFSKKNKINISNPIEISFGTKKLPVNVSGIINNFEKLAYKYEPNRGRILLAIDTENLHAIAGKKIAYSGAFIRCKNSDAFKESLSTYKPYGRLKNRNQFKSQKEYNEYLTFFNNGDYRREIEYLNDTCETASSKANLLKAAIFGGLDFIIVLIMFFLLLTDKNINNNIRLLLENGMSFMPLEKGIKKLFWGLLAQNGLELLILTPILISCITDYCPLKFYLPVLFISIFIPLFLCYCLMQVFSKSLTRKVKKIYDLTEFEKLKESEIKLEKNWNNGKSIYIKILEKYPLAETKNIHSKKCLDVKKLNIDALLFGTIYKDQNSLKKIIKFIERAETESKNLLKLSKNHMYLYGKIIQDQKPIIIKYTKKRPKKI